MAVILINGYEVVPTKMFDLDVVMAQAEGEADKEIVDDPAIL